MLSVLAIVWLAWAVFNITLACMIGRIAVRNGVEIYVTGVLRPRIYVTDNVKRRLTSREYDAVIAHELGHIAYGHIWQNLLLAIFVPLYRPAKLSLKQELQADSFAVHRGYAGDLASALRKLSTSPVDSLRADLLEKVSVKLATHVSGIDTVRSTERVPL